LPIEAGCLFAWGAYCVQMEHGHMWLWAAAAAVFYGWLALRFSIYGRAGVKNWKNALLSIVILLGVLAVSLKSDALPHAPARDPIAIALAAALSTIVSDALEAPNQRWRPRYNRGKNVRG
jgi:hypothetical protein